MKSTTRLRELLHAPAPVIVPGAYEAFSAKLMQDYGFSAVYLGGLASATTLCTAEPLLDMTEQVGHARLVAAHLSVPLIVDGHTGFGDPVHITRAVREFEAAGIAGIHLEDVDYPKRVHYFKGIKHVVPVETMLARLDAALAARRDPDFVIIARTDAYGAVGGSLEEAIRRLEAYRSAGVDALMPLVPDLDGAAEAARRFPDSPLVYISGGGKFAEGDPPAAHLGSLGYQLVLYPDLPIADAVMAVDRFCRELKETGNVSYRREDHMAARETIFKTIGLPEAWKIEAETTERGTSE